MSALLLFLIRLYQRTLSPLLGDCCRYEPSCSRYAAACIRHHGAARGGWLALLRILRCNPLFSGGIDLPPGVAAERAGPDWSRVASLCECPRQPAQRTPEEVHR